MNLDGTLTCIEGKAHHSVNSYINSHLVDWKGMIFNIYDVNAVSCPVETRISLVEDLQARTPPDPNFNFIRPVQCQNLQHLIQRAKELSKFGNDSILLRAPKSMYEKGKSEKFRRAVIFNLQPAIVTSIAGPFILRCQFVDGTDFYVSHSLAEPAAPIGSVVMIKYNNKNEDGEPRHAFVIPWEGVLNWDDVKAKRLTYNNQMIGDVLYTK